MKLSKRLMTYLVLGVILFALFIVSFHFIFLELVIDFWWFSSLEYKAYFWLRTFYKYLIPGFVTLCFLFIFLSNFWIASRYIVAKNAEDINSSSTGLGKKFRTGALIVYFPLSLIMSVLIALPFHFHWEKAILFFFAPKSGVNDPIFDIDVSFYMFSLPIYQLIQKELFVITLLLLVAIAFLYWLEHKFFSEVKQPFPTGAKIHLAVIAALLCIYVVIGLLFERYKLLYNTRQEPIFFGPGYIEINYHIPLIWMMIFIFLLAVASYLLLYFSKGKKGQRLCIGLPVIFLLILILRNTSFFPQLVNRFVVQPNPVTTQKNSMQFNTQATLNAYALDNVNIIDFQPDLTPLDNLLNWEGKENLNNVPLWETEYLKDVYSQLQGLRPYFSFAGVSEDRYLINGSLTQVNLSAREINTKLLPLEAQNWENLHLRYTHGYGAVMTPAAQVGGQPHQWFLRDLKLYSPVGIKLTRPNIFYGLENYTYAIVPNDLKTKGLALIEMASGKNIVDAGGIRISSLFHKLLFSIYFKEEKIFFSMNISDQSRMLMRRNIIQRIEKLTPYLKLDSEPYLVIEDGQMYWIQDAYTTSNEYPISKRSYARFRTAGKTQSLGYNYIRNSVKIIIDAHNGKTDFFVADSDDPIIKAYQTAYPGFFKLLNDMPQGLQKHLRYPRDMFYQQMKIYKSYHQIKPEIFYQQAETWDFPNLGGKEMKPYYLTTKLADCHSKQRLVLLALMTPVNLNNLSAFATADIVDEKNCAQNYKPSITVYKVKKDIQLDGPVQISAMIDQDPVISEQLTLWGQHGSIVKRGRMILLPVDNTVLYMQPVYLISTKTQIPELARVILAAGNEVSMHQSANEAFKKLEINLGADPSVVYPENPTSTQTPVNITPNDKSVIKQ